MLEKELDRKIRVLHVVGAMNAAGLETLIMNIYRNIDRSKVQFDFLVQTSVECFYDKEIIELGGRIIQLPTARNNLMKYKKAFEEALYTYGPYDAIHSHVLFFSGITLEIAKKNNIPIRIAHSHNTDDSKNNKLSRKIYRNIMSKKINKNATNMLGCSEEACLYVFGKKAFERNEAEIFPNAIDISNFNNNIDNTYLLEELGLKADTKLIGHIGRFTKQKNHKLLIEIFEEYLSKNPNTHLILVGEGRDKQIIREMIKEKNMEEHIHFLGVRKDISNILNSLDVFLFPSLYEGLGIVLIEAQAANTPCVVSDNLPNEADLNIGLMDRVKLSADLKVWTEGIDNALKTEKKSWKTISSSLNKNGYNIVTSSEKLLNIYNGSK